MVIRWTVAAFYIALVFFLTDTNEVLRWVSSCALVACNLHHLWRRVIRNSADPRLVAAIGMTDVVLVTLGIVTLSNTDTPLWAIYVAISIGMTGSLSAAQIGRQSLWASANCLAAAFIVARMGGHVQWVNVSGQSFLIMLMAYQSQNLAAGNRRVHTGLSQRADIDGLTGIANRGSLLRECGVAISAATLANTTLAVVIMDVDHFKLINDEGGHAAGDEALQSVARTLEMAKGPGGLVARLGGDEFACLAPGLSRTDAEAWCERVRITAELLNIGLTLGVAVFPEDGADVSALMESADAALYRGKRAGRGRVTRGSEAA
jgi:diguanylate cyclase (GGDEF)-like protein